MKTSSLLLSVLAAGSLLGACGTSPSANTQSTGSNNSNSQPSSESTKGGALKSIKDLLASGVAQKCTWSTENDGQKVSGTILIKDKKFRQEYEMKIEGSTVKTYAISDGQYMYTWNDQNKTAGIKIKIDEAESTAKSTSDAAADNEPVDAKGKAVDMEKEMNYNCSPSTISDADVTPPSDVKFVDMAETLKGLQDKFKDFKLPEQ